MSNANQANDDSWVFDTTGMSEDVLEDYMSELCELHEHMGHDLGVLESNPSSFNAVQDLLISIRALKRRSHDLLLEPVESCLLHMEHFVEHLMQSKLPCDLLLKEVIFLSLDQVKFSAEVLVRRHKLNTRCLKEVSHGFDQLSHLCGGERDTYCESMIKTISGIDLSAVSSDMVQTQVPRSKETHLTTQIDTVDEATATELVDDQTEKDLKFFEILAGICDLKVSFWKGRTQKVLAVSLGINQFLDQPVDTCVLKAAVFTHDLGMAFIPDHILHMRRKLNAMEEERVRAHARLAYEMLVRMDRWKAVAEIVLQHHERVDGQGYPNRLTSDNIVLGAKILAVSDTYVSVTSNRPDRSQRRSVLRGAKEINVNAGSQFDPQVVGAFNQYLRQAYGSG